MSAFFDPEGSSLGIGELFASFAYTVHSNLSRWLSLERHSSSEKKRCRATVLVLDPRKKISDRILSHDNSKSMSNHFTNLNFTCLALRGLRVLVSRIIFFRHPFGS